MYKLVKNRYCIFYELCCMILLSYQEYSRSSGLYIYIEYTGNLGACMCMIQEVFYEKNHDSYVHGDDHGHHVRRLPGED